jgi:hypothetical protein
MIRPLTLATAAALVLAAPASAKSIRVATAGKSAEQVQADVTRAARSLCVRETIGASFPHDLQRACVKHTVSRTLEQMAAKPSSTQLATR